MLQKFRIISLPLIAAIILWPGISFAGTGFRALTMSGKHANNTPCGPIAFVQSIWAQESQDFTVSQSLTTTNGNLIVAIAYGGQGPNTASPNQTFTVSDSLGNTWYPGPMYENSAQGNNSSVQMFYAVNVLGGADVFTATSTVNGQPSPWTGLMVLEYTGIATTDVVDISTGQSAPVSTNNYSPGNMTIRNTCDLVVGAFSDGAYGGAAQSAGVGWTMNADDSWDPAASVDNAPIGSRTGNVVNPVLFNPQGPDQIWVAAQMAFRASNTSALAQPTKLAFTTSAVTAPTWTCSAATIQSQNASSVATITSTGIPIALSASNTTFYADSGCLYPITSALIGAGTSSTTFYFSSATVSSPVISAAATGYTTVTQTESISTHNAYTWIGSLGGSACTSAPNWNNGACWQGGAAPGTTNYAIFDSTCTASCNPTVNVDPSVYGIILATGTLTTLTQGAHDLTVGPGGFLQQAGTFTGATNTTKNTTFNGPFVLAGGTFTSSVGSSTISSLILNGFTQTGGTFNGSATAAAATLVNGSFTVTGGSFTMPAGSLTDICNFKVSNSATFTVTAGSTLGLGNAGSQSGQGCSVDPGAVTYANVQFFGGGYTFDLNGKTMTVGGNLSAGDSFGDNQMINNGTLNVTGNVTAINSGFGGSVVITMVGNASGQTINGNAILLPRLKIAAGSNNVTLSGTVAVSGYTYVSGNLITTGSTLSYWCHWPDASCYGVPGVFAPGTPTYNNMTIQGDGTSFDLAGAIVTVSGDLKVGDINETDHLLNNGTFNVGGNVIGNGNGYRGNAVIKLVGNASGQTITGNGANLPVVNIAAGTNPVTLSGDVKVSGYTLTSAGAVATGGSTLELSCWYVDTACAAVQAIFSPGSVTYNNLVLGGYVTTFDLGGATVHVGGNLTFDDVGWFVGPAISNGVFSVAGSLTVNDNGHGGTAFVDLIGSNTRAISIAAGAGVPGGDVLVNGGTTNLTSDVAWNSGSQALTISSGTVNMQGHALAVGGTLTISSGATLTKSLGALTYGSLANSGTLNP